MTEEAVYIGIDPTSGARAMTYAVLNAQLQVLEVVNAAMDEILAAVGKHSAAVCAVDAPIGPNKGLMADPEYRARLGLNPKRLSYASFRVCEYELRRRGIGLYNTHPDPEQISSWMKTGWQLYDQLRALGFVEYPRPGQRRMCEVHPHACYVALVDRRPYPKLSVEGRLQRQMVLYDEGLGVPNPMHILEEWTRHRLLTGQLNLDELYGHDALDALVSAYTAFMLDREPHHTIAVGDAAEGQIVLPTSVLRDSYS